MATIGPVDELVEGIESIDVDVNRIPFDDIPEIEDNQIDWYDLTDDSFAGFCLSANITPPTMEPRL